MVFTTKAFLALMAAFATLGGGLYWFSQDRDAQTSETPAVQQEQQSEAPAAEPAPEVQVTVAPVEEPAPAPTPAPEVETAQPAPAEEATPSFDVLRVDEGGNVVVAGRAAPGSEVDIIVGNQVAETVEADERGEFATVLADPLGEGTSSVRLSATAPDGEVLQSEQEVTVFLEEQGTAPLVVAQEPDGPTEILQQADPVIASTAEPGDAIGPAAEAGEPMLIRTVDVRPPERVGGDNRVVVAGSGPAGVPVRLYLQDSLVGETQASSTGDWIISFNSQMAPGRYVLRADQLDPATGSVVARAQTRFLRAAVAEARAPEPAAPANLAQDTGATDSGATDPGSVTVLPPPGETVVGGRTIAADDDVQVVRGDSLWRISRNLYGQGVLYSVIFEANRGQITDPNLIFPGQVFTIPEFNGALPGDAQLGGALTGK